MTTTRWSSIRKLEAVTLYRRHGVPSEGITIRELRQWDAIDRRYPSAKLKLSLLTVVHLRVACPSAATIADTLPLPPMSPQRARLCASVQGLTEAEGICTPADLSHTLWKEAVPLDAAVFDVQVCVINSILKKHNFSRRIKRHWGRGFEWV